MPGPGSYWFGEEEIKEVMDVMESGYLFRYGAPDNPAFKGKVYSLERDFAAYIGVEHTLAVSSGTGALLLSLLAMGIGPGDEVVVPTYTFVATYTAVIFTGAVPVLAEIDESLTIDPADLERRITPNTKAVIPVHMLGNSCDMGAIADIANRHRLMVLEDACQAAGASYKGKKLGSIGKMGAFSLNIFKTITSGDGGIIVTDNTDLYERAYAFHDQGHAPNRDGEESINRNILGLNFRVNELVGAVALAQLRKIDAITKTLRAKKNTFKELILDIEGVGFRTLNDPAGECGTLLTVIFDSADHAACTAERLGTKTVDHSGWHVYANMEHVNAYFKGRGRPSGRGSYPLTDDILSRSINLSVGVVDSGLGSAFGINIDSTDNEIEEAADKFRTACRN